MFTKKRWVGKTVQGLFEEFGGYPNYYFVSKVDIITHAKPTLKSTLGWRLQTRSIRLGLITVNGERASPDTVIKGGEFIVHRVCMLERWEFYGVFGVAFSRAG